MVSHLAVQVGKESLTLSSSPEVGYCQGMAQMAAFGLYHLALPEEDVFSFLTSMILHIFPREFLDPVHFQVSLIDLMLCIFSNPLVVAGCDCNCRTRGWSSPNPL